MEPQAFLELLERNKVTLERMELGSGLITLVKKFTPDSKSEYVAAESDVSMIYEVPARGGSTWGTDGGSVGGAIGCRGGYMRLNRSGCNKVWLKKLAKLRQVVSEVTRG